MTANDNPAEPEFVRRRRRGVLGKRERRTVVVFLLASVIAGGSIAAAAFLKREPPRIMPPESPEEVALRNSPDNAFIPVVEAIKLIPPTPLPLYANEEDNAGFVGLYIPQPGSLGLMLNVGRADDDPEFQAQLAAVTPAVDAIRAALAKPHFRLPPDYTPQQTAVLTLAPELARFAMAAGINRVRTGISQHERELVLDLMRLGGLINQDGGLGVHGAALQVQSAVLRAAWDAALGPVSPDRRTALLAEIEQLSLAHASVKHHLDFEWRVLDRPDGFWILTQNPQGANQPSQDIEDVIERMMIGRAVNKLRRHIVANRDLYYQAAEVPLTEIHNWQMQHPQVSRNRVMLDPMQGILGAINARTIVDAWMRGLKVRAQIEQYEDQHAAYPATLDEAGIELLDPFSGAPFLYRAHPGEYTLYSVGMNRRDDDADWTRDRDIVIQRATAEPPLESLPGDLRMLGIGGRR